MFHKSKSVLIMVIVIVSLFALSCKNNDQAMQAADKPVSDNMGQGMVYNTGDTIHIQAMQFKFDPSTITIKKGAAVKLILQSKDVTHGFAIAEYNLNVVLPPGVEKTVDFTADKAGTFTYFCSVYCGSGHKDMKGTLIVK
jgi:cytochrome c oxidase subunit 2